MHILCGAAVIGLTSRPISLTPDTMRGRVRQHKIHVLMVASAGLPVAGGQGVKEVKGQICLSSPYFLHRTALLTVV
jgi:hypothetical protein